MTTHPPSARPGDDDARQPGAVRGAWEGDPAAVRTGPDGMVAALARVGRPVTVVLTPDGPAAAVGGRTVLGDGAPADGGLDGSLPVLAHAPACRPEQLGDPGLRRDFGVKYAYVAGAMANGIASVEVVEAMARAGMLGFFGAAGLPLARVEAAVDRLGASLGDLPHGFNLIHSPNEPAIEAAVADLYLRRGVRLVSASAYLGLTLPLVRYRLHGIHRDTDGRVVAPNRVVGKISRVEVATRFLSPPPDAMVRDLVAAGDLTEGQAAMAREIPVAQDLTAEADSGGHTDNRPLVALVPSMLALRDRMQAEHGYRVPLRVGAAGGISTPASAAAALATGAAFVLTGSVNQACVEAGTSDLVREMLAAAEQADVTMAPAADMFEMGVKVQVLKRGTMFAMRAQKLLDLYRARDSLEALTPAERSGLERTVFRKDLAAVWEETRRFFLANDPSQVARAEADPHHRMALVFRWYLGQSSHWANAGLPDRKVDYQVWCGPAMGAFNEWTRGTFLAEAGNRRVADVARAVLHGAAVLHRARVLAAQGVALPPAAWQVPPRTPAEIEELER